MLGLLREQALTKWIWTYLHHAFATAELVRQKDEDEVRAVPFWILTVACCVLTGGWSLSAVVCACAQGDPDSEEEGGEDREDTKNQQSEKEACLAPFRTTSCGCRLSDGWLLRV